jgi:hypothetical protein
MEIELRVLTGVGSANRTGIENWRVFSLLDLLNYLGFNERKIKSRPLVLSGDFSSDTW